MTPAVSLALPVLPVSPELPDAAVGLPSAVELAPPVLPVLVAEDCAVEAPELPEKALGVWEASIHPPSPPLASVLAMESPPVTGPVPPVLRLPRRKRLLAVPARS